MLEDYDMELTANPNEGETVADSAYGSTPYDLRAAGSDPSVGDPLQALYEVTEEFAGDIATLAISLVTDTNGLGGSEVELLTTGDIDVEDLLIANGVQRLGTVQAGTATKRYLTAKFTADDAASAGKVRVWLQKGTDVIPVNSGAL